MLCHSGSDVSQHGTQMAGNLRRSIEVTDGQVDHVGEVVQGTSPVEADGAVDAQNTPTAPWNTLRVFHELPQGLSPSNQPRRTRKEPQVSFGTPE